MSQVLLVCQPAKTERERHRLNYSPALSTKDYAQFEVKHFIAIDCTSGWTTESKSRYSHSVIIFNLSLLQSNEALPQ